MSGGALYFANTASIATPLQGRDPYGIELWRSDGTAAGTVMVQDINRGPDDALASSNGHEFKISGSLLYFTPVTNEFGAELWAMPITNAATPAPAITSALTLTGTKTIPLAPYTITATNSPFQFTAQNLPPGLFLDEASGVISGTPTQSGFFNVPISAVNSGATATAVLLIDIAKAEPFITSASSLSVATNTAVNHVVTASGLAPITFSAVGIDFSSGTAQQTPLPAGLTFAGDTLSGTATQAGFFTIRFTAANSAGSATQDFSLAVMPPPPMITSSLNVTAVAGMPFTYTAAATGAEPLTYEFFPAFADAFTSSGAVLNATFSAAGTATFTITVFDSVFQSDTRVVTVTVLDISSAPDTDGDGMIDALDTDDDNDGTSDSNEVSAGTNPLDPNSKPGGSADFDGDGITDSQDTDDDNDGISDMQEIAAGSNPFDPLSTPSNNIDTDGDGMLNGVDLDDDNDGFIDEIEIALGTSSTNAADTPFNDQPTGAPLPLTIAKMSVKLTFSKPLSDSLIFSGTLPIDAGFAVLNQQVTVDIGGIVQQFTLNEKGQSPRANNTLKVGVKAVKGVVAIQVAKYSVKFSKGNFAANLRDEGFINANVDGSSRTVRVTVLFAQKVFQADQALIYSAKAGKSGKTNLP